MDSGFLKFTENTSPMTISQTISRLLEKLLNSHENIESLPEFKFLRDKSVYGDDSIDLIASKALLIVVEKEKITTRGLLSEITTLFATTKCTTNIAFLINNILLIELRKELAKDKNYMPCFNLQLPQHPFVTLVKENPSYWRAIFQEISSTYELQDLQDTEELPFAEHLHALYKPVLLFTLCGPHDPKLSVFKEKLWAMFLQYEDSGRTIRFLLSWMQLGSKETIRENSELLILLDQVECYPEKNLTIIQEDWLFMFETAILYQLIINNLNPNPILSIIGFHLYIQFDPILTPAALIMAKILYVCSPVHLGEILRICARLIEDNSFDVITQNVLIAGLLHWTGNPSLLTKAESKLAQEIIVLIKNKGKNTVWIENGQHRDFEAIHSDLLHASDDVYIALKLSILLDTLNTIRFAEWIQKLKFAPTFFLHKIFHFLFGIYVISFEDQQIELNVHELVSRIVLYDPKLKPYLLTLIFYKLTLNKHSELHFKLLKLLSSMGEHLECTSKIVGIIQAVAKGSPVLNILSTSLMLDLWKVNPTCYPYLEKHIMTSFDQSRGNKWDFYTSKAQILKEICALKPELHGKEMVPHLSKILNECSAPEGSLPFSLAIDGITLLCRFDIIDAGTTWTSLAPILRKDTRLNVIKSVCCFIQEIANLSYTEALHGEVVTKLWDYVASTTDQEIWQSALESLTHFSLETILDNMPESYLTEDMLNAKASGQKLTHECWLFFLANCPKSNLRLAGDFFIKLIRIEIENFLKFVYHTKDIREPTDYSVLVPNSVLRGLTFYVRHNEAKWKVSICAEIFVECLRILSQKYPKPLPPFDWCFLQELIHEPETRYYALEIASRQVVISGSARRLIVNFVEGMTGERSKNEQDILTIYSKLIYLAKSVQPFILEPFLKYTTLYAIEMYSMNTDFLEKITEFTRQTLEDPDVQEANKSVIAQNIIEILDQYDVDSKIFELFLQCVVLFPKAHLQYLTSPKVMKEMTDDWFKKAIRISCFHAAQQKTALFAILNEIIEYGYLFPKLKKYFYDQISTVFSKQIDNKECIMWLLDFIGQIHSMTVEKSDTASISFHCDIFILAVVIFSGHNTFLKNLTNQSSIEALLPGAVASLFDTNQWNICTHQGLDWFHVMTTQAILNETYRELFKKCLQTLRHDSEFSKNMKWIKYLNVNK